MMFSPSASRVSAVPACEEAAREPCLTTLAPAAAATIAAIVEMFTVFARSPPVPTTSTASRSRVTWTALASIAELRPSISSSVSPLARSATSRAASCTSLARPERISLSAHWAASLSRPSLRTSPARMSGQVWVMTLSPSSSRSSSPGAAQRPDPAAGPDQPGRARLPRHVTRCPARHQRRERRAVAPADSPRTPP